jgi:hypothetical protein
MRIHSPLRRTPRARAGADSLVNGGSHTKLLLGILAAVLLVSGWFYLRSDDEGAAPAPAARRGAGLDPEGGGTVAPASSPSRGRGAEARAAVPEVIALHFADLERTPHTYRTGRDPWRFVEPPPPPPPVPKAPTKAELEARRLAEEARLKAAADAAAEAARIAAIPKPPPFTWTYLGNFGPVERRIAVFADGKTIYNAQQGETLAGKFIVAQIGYESVDIRFVGFPEWPAQRLAVGR